MMLNSVKELISELPDCYGSKLSEDDQMIVLNCSRKLVRILVNSGRLGKENRKKIIDISEALDCIVHEIEFAEFAASKR